MAIDLGTVKTIDLPPSEPALTDPFAATEEETPDLFSAVEEPPEEIAASRPPNPVTTQIAALADTNENASGNDVDVITYLNGALERAEQRLAAGEEGRMRSDATIKRSLQRQVALSDDRTMELSPQLKMDLRARAAQDSAATFDQNMRTALEREALDQIEDLAAAGDTVQARIIMNRLTPGKMDVADAWREQNVKQMLLAQAAEEFRQEDNQEGWFQMAWSGLVGMFQPSAFSYLGNIDEGAGGFQERFWRFFTPGSDMQRQAEALWSMSAEELAEYLPKLKENIRSNSTNLGAYNPDKALELIDMFQNPIGEDAAFGMTFLSTGENLLNIAPGVGFVPYRAVGAAVSVPLIMARSGARKQAAEKVSQAFDTLVNEGPEAAMKKHGMDEETIIGNILPTAVNPVRAADGDELMVPLAGEANYNAQQVRDFIAEWKLVQTERMTSPEEIQAAAKAIADKIATRYGSPSIDFDVVTVKLVDGTVTRRVKATLGRPDGKGGFASEVEARGYMQNFGYNPDRTIVKEVVTESGPLSQADEGFTTQAFHGSKSSEIAIAGFQNEKLGKTTGAGSAKVAHFFASPRGAYRGGIEIDDSARTTAEKSLAEHPLTLYERINFFFGRNPAKTDIPEDLQKYFEYDEAGMMTKQSQEFINLRKKLREYNSGEDAFNFGTYKKSQREVEELQKIIDENTPVNKEHAVNLAWSYARMAQKDNPAWDAVQANEEAASALVSELDKVKNGILAEVKEDFKTKGIYIRSGDELYSVTETPEELAWKKANPEGDVVYEDDVSVGEVLDKAYRSDPRIAELNEKLQETYSKNAELWEAYEKSAKDKIDNFTGDNVRLKEIADKQSVLDDQVNDLLEERAPLNWDTPEYEALTEKIRALNYERATLDTDRALIRLEAFFKNPSELLSLLTKNAKDKAYVKDEEDLLIDVNSRLAAVEDSVGLSWFDQAAYEIGITEEQLKKMLKSDALFDKANDGGIVYPVNIKTSNMKVVEGNRSKYDEVIYKEELDKAKEEGFDGVVFKDARDPGNIDSSLPSPPDGSYDVIAVFDPQNVRMALEPPKIKKDVSGQHFVEVEMDIPDTAFMTNLLKPPTQGFLAKWYKNTSQTSDPDMYAKAVQADQKFNKMQKLLDKQLTSAFRGLSSNERMWLGQVLAKGQNVERWFTPEEFSVLVERAMGKPPSERMIKAYEQYRFNNDVEHALRNDGVYREKVIRGFESVKFSGFGDQFDVDARVDATPTVVPKERIFNISDELHYVGDKTLTPSELSTKTAQGYILFKTEKPIKLKDGTEIRTFMAKKGDVEFRPLRQEQLAYSPGGHRLYTDRYFVKQASKGVQPDTGQKFLRSANTFATGATIKDVRDYARIMDEARDAVKKGKDAEYLDKVIFRGRGGPADKGMPFPTGEEFIADIKSGKIDLDEPFEAVFDRELPSAYSAAGEDVARFIDEEDLKGATAHMAQTGRMYYSSKGDQLRSTKGGLAPTVDPFEAQSQALFNVARMSASFSDFKTSAIDRWVNTYKQYLNTRDLPEDQASSPVAIFNNSTPKRDMPIALRQQMLGQRESIQRILGFESDFDRGYRHWMRSTAEWIVGDSDNALRKKMSEGVFWLQDNNPVGFLRGLAFDMKLGMFNIGQFFIQTSTMFSALALNPKHGKFGLASAIPVWSYFLSKGSEDVLETLAKRGVHKLAGFEDVTQFKNYVREANRTGFFDLGDDHIMVNDQGPARTFGSLQGGVHAAREAGRFFFYNAEVLNRLVAHRIAYGEAVERFGIEAADSFQFKELVARRAENYSFNMSNTSKAWWQQGLLSIPTQFWAYNVRMIEAMTGKNFTAAQKARLIGAQFLMAGTGGIPVVAGLAEYVKNKHGVEPDIDSMLGTLDRGLGDRLIFELTDADVMVGEKWGTGSWSSDLVKDLFGMSEYNERPFASIVGGATGSIMFQTIGPALDIIKYYMTHESGAEDVNLAGDEWVKLFKQVSTINNGLKAYMVYNYGIYQSTKGTVLATDVPSQDAAAIAMGFRPHELEISSVGKAYLDDRSEAISDAANQLKAWRQEAFTRPDLLEENAKKANAFVKLLPPDIRRDVVKRAHRTTDPSFYTGIVERLEKVRRKEELYESVAEGTAE